MKMSAINFTIFLKKIERGEKKQTIRLAKCVCKDCRGYNLVSVGEDVKVTVRVPNRLRDDRIPDVRRPDCYAHCEKYTPRIRTGDIIKLYTGMRRRDYCRDPDGYLFEEKARPGEICRDDVNVVSQEFPQCVDPDGYFRCSDCDKRGAKLLVEGVCTEVIVKRYDELTEEDALRDGFEDGFQQEFCDRYCHFERSRELCNPCPAIFKLKLFLLKNYDAKPETLFNLIRWELKN